MAHSKAYQYVTPYDINHVISSYGKALSYPARVMIMRWLAAEGPKNAGEISTYIELSKSTTSHHLASLEKAGMITGSENGRYIEYVFNPAAFSAMRHFMNKIFDEVEKASGMSDQE